MAINKDKVRAAAQRHLQKGHIDKAIREFQRLVEADPRDVRTLLKIGDLQTRKGQKQQATETYSRVAEFYAGQGFYLKAVAVYKQILKIDPELVDINVKLAELYHQLGLVSDASNQYRQLCQVFEQQGRTQDCIDILKKMVDLDPENVASRIKLAELQAKEGFLDQAREGFQHAAEYLKTHNRSDDYIKVAERIVYFDPSDTQTARELAQLYIQKNDPRRALAKLQIAFNEDPTGLGTLQLLANAFQELGQAQKTISVYKEMARLHQSAQDHDAFYRVMHSILALEPNDADALSALRQGSAGEAPPAIAAPTPAGEPGSDDELEVDLEDDLQEVEAIEVPPDGEATTPTAEAVVTDADEAQEDAIHRILVETDIYIKYGLRDKAIGHLNELLARVPAHRGAQMKLKELHTEADNTEAATETLWSMATQSLDSNRTSDARADLEELLNLAPEHEAARELLAQIAPDAHASPQAAAAQPASVANPPPNEASDLPLTAAAAPTAQPDGTAESEAVVIASDAELVGAQTDAEELQTPREEDNLEVELEVEAEAAEQHAPSSIDDAVDWSVDIAADDAPPTDPGHITPALAEADAELAEIEPTELEPTDPAVSEHELIDTEPDDFESAELESIYVDPEHVEPATTATSANASAAAQQPVQRQADTLEPPADPETTDLETAGLGHTDLPPHASEPAEAAPQNAQAGQAEPSDTNAAGVHEPEAEPAAAEAGRPSEPAAAARHPSEPAAASRAPASNAAPKPQSAVSKPRPAAPATGLEDLDELLASAVPKRKSSGTAARPGSRPIGETPAAAAAAPSETKEAPAAAATPSETKEAPAAAATPSETDEAPAADTQDIGDEVAEIEFLFDQGLWEDGRQSLKALLTQHPGHPELVALQSKLAQIETTPDNAPAARDETESAHPAPDQPEAGVDQPEAEARQPEAEVDQPEDEARQPKTAANQPEAEVDEPEAETVFLDEVDLAAELEEDFAEVAASDDFEVSFSDVFSEFKRGVAREVSDSDYDTHYNLGIAYKEMGLLEDAIREFELARLGSEKAIAAMTMIGLCELERGNSDAALQAFSDGLNHERISTTEAMALRYEIARAYESMERYGDAFKFYEKVRSLDPAFRDVSERIADVRARAPDSSAGSSELDVLLQDTAAEKAAQSPPAPRNKISYI
mgnify:CR=1 FL=1